jgi:hypothetical protein
MNVNKTDTRHNLWHKLLGKVFEELLTPVNITVETSLKIMAESPEAIRSIYASAQEGEDMMKYYA